MSTRTRNRRRDSYTTGLTGKRGGPEVVISERGVPINAPALGLADPIEDRDRLSPAAVEVHLCDQTTDNSRRAVQQALVRTLELLGEDASKLEQVRWWRLTSTHIKVLRRHLITGDYSASTINLTLSSLRGLCRTMVARGEMAESCLKAICAVKNQHVDAHTTREARVLTIEEVSSLFESCREDTERGHPAGVRDAAMLSLIALGLRRAELVATAPNPRMT